MEGIDHVDIVKVCGSRFVCDVDGMAKGEVPDGEGLELRITRIDAPLVLVIELGKTGSQLAASGSGSGNDNERPCGLNEIILAVTLVGYDERNVRRIAVDGIVEIALELV